MTKGLNKYIRNLSIFLVAIFLFAGSTTAFGQSTQNGKWRAKISNKDSEKIYISFYRDKDKEAFDDDFDNKTTTKKHRQHVSGSSYQISELQGLSTAQITATNANVNFSLVREAGTIQMSGTFTNGKGSGTWNFTPDPNFISALNNLGFSNISDEKIFASAMLNVKTRTVTELRNAGLENLDFDDIFKATIFKIDANYISEMSAAGFNKLDMEDLVQARIFKIDAKYAREMLAQGFGSQSIEKLVQYRIFKITPEYLAEMKAEGLSNLTPEDLVQLRIFKIDSAFIQKARAKGYTNPSVGELVELKIHGKVN